MMNAAAVTAITVHLPERVETSADLAAEFPGWPVAKIEKSTGIAARHIAAPGECASDLAALAAQKLFASGVCTPGDIDFLLFCTETPDHLLPPSACLLQHRLGLRTSAGAMDFNLGSSGYVYGLALAQGLIETQGLRHVLLLTADTYSKIIHPADKSTRTIFGDAAAATLISAVPVQENGMKPMGPFVFGTDGRGATNLIVPAGGMREPHSAATATEQTDESGNIRSRDHLFMDGGEIFSFTLSAVPKMLAQIYAASGKTKEDVDLFVFHQPNQSMLETLRKQAGIPPERFAVHVRECGNTVSATIPLALQAAAEQNQLRPGMQVLLAGFGVGYSWASTILRWVG
jgi:3-oxoacyl-[acyl-carrier-protein] synthase III